MYWVPFCMLVKVFSFPVIAYIFALSGATAYISHFTENKTIEQEVSGYMLTSCEHHGKQKQWTRRDKQSSAGLCWILWGKLSQTNCASSHVGCGRFLPPFWKPVRCQTLLGCSGCWVMSPTLKLPVFFWLEYVLECSSCEGFCVILSTKWTFSLPRTTNAKCQKM